LPTIIAYHHRQPSSPTIIANHHRQPSSPTIIANHHRQPSSPAIIANHHRQPSSPTIIVTFMTNTIIVLSSYSFISLYIVNTSSQLLSPPCIHTTKYHHKFNVSL
jgi:hypothetical protein